MMQKAGSISLADLRKRFHAPQRSKRCACSSEDTGAALEAPPATDDVALADEAASSARPAESGPELSPEAVGTPSKGEQSFPRQRCLGAACGELGALALQEVLAPYPPANSP